METGETILYLITPTAQIGLIIGIAEIAKKIGLAHRWIPILDIVLGLISGIFVYGLAQGYGILNGVLLGLAMGLSACGLFSGVKNVFALGSHDADTDEYTDGEADGD